MLIDVDLASVAFATESFAEIEATPAPAPLVDGEVEAAARYAVELNSSLKPFDLFELQLVDIIATQTVRIGHCQQQQRDLRASRAARARPRSHPAADA